MQNIRALKIQVNKLFKTFRQNKYVQNRKEK